jgi:hypothetical protein
VKKVPLVPDGAFLKNSGILPVGDFDKVTTAMLWKRRTWILGLVSISPLATGCRGYSYGQLLKPTDKDLVGSHEAGSEVFHPLVDESVAKLLTRQQEQCHIGPDGIAQ